MQIWYYPPPLKRRTPGIHLPCVATIREHYLKVVWRRAEWLQRLLLWVAVATWWAWAVIEALRFTTKLGARVRSEVGKSSWRQLQEQITLAWQSLIPPANYYMFELYRDAHRARAEEYLLRAETKGGAFFLLRPQQFVGSPGTELEFAL